MPNQDQVTLINEQDEVIGSMDKLEAHRGEGKLHRAISVFLFRKNKSGELELLIQQRSDKKIVGAGQWANTVCGNVWPGESYEDCAKRRLSFELGMIENIQLQPVHKFQYHVKCNEEFSENEIDQVFIGWFDEVLKPNPDEVKNTAWVSWKKIINEAERKNMPYEWAPWFEIMMKNEVVTKINNTII